MKLTKETMIVGRGQTEIILTKENLFKYLDFECDGYDIDISGSLTNAFYKDVVITYVDTDDWLFYNVYLDASGCAVCDLLDEDDIDITATPHNSREMADREIDQFEDCDDMSIVRVKGSIIVPFELN